MSQIPRPHPDHTLLTDCHELLLHMIITDVAQTDLCPPAAQPTAVAMSVSS